MEVYDPEEDSVFIVYLDENNLYGWARSQPLPVDGHHWMEEEELENWEELSSDEGKGCILDVDLEYPLEYHNLHNEYPLAPERLKVGNVEKLISNLYDKKKYVLHYKNLKQYLCLGLLLTKIHRDVIFNERPWLRNYIQLNTDLRTRGTTDFEKDFFKLMNNSVFGKTMENVRNRVDVRLVSRENEFKKFARKTTFDRPVIFSENLTAVHMLKATVKLDKPIHLGMSILDFSKTLMYDFHYNYLKNKYGDNAQLCLTDTDSFIYEIRTEDFYKDIQDDVESRFDTSAYPKDHPATKFGFPVKKNKKVIGKMKDDCAGKQISETIALGAKLYCYKLDNGKETKKCKGVKECILQNEITLENYKNCLATKKKAYRKMIGRRRQTNDRRRRWNSHVCIRTLASRKSSTPKRRKVVDASKIDTVARRKYVGEACVGCVETTIDMKKFFKFCVKFENWFGVVLEWF